MLPSVKTAPSLPEPRVMPPLKVKASPSSEHLKSHQQTRHRTLAAQHKLDPAPAEVWVGLEGQTQARPEALQALCLRAVPKVGDKPLPTVPKVGDKPVPTVPKVGDKPVPTVPKVGDKPVPTVHKVGDKPVPTVPKVGDKAVPTARIATGRATSRCCQMMWS